MPVPNQLNPVQTADAENGRQINGVGSKHCLGVTCYPENGSDAPQSPVTFLKDRRLLPTFSPSLTSHRDACVSLQIKGSSLVFLSGGVGWVSSTQPLPLEVGTWPSLGHQSSLSLARDGFLVERDCTKPVKLSSGTSAETARKANALSPRTVDKTQNQSSATV